MTDQAIDLTNDEAVDTTADQWPPASPLPGADVDPARRSSWRWWLTLALAAAVLLGAAGFARSTAADRDDAHGARRRARAELVRSRAAAADARHDLDRVREGATQVRVRLAGPLATVENLVVLHDQGLAATRDAQRLGPDRSYDGVLAYNEAVTRANVVVDEHDAAIERLDQQLNELLGVDLPAV